MKKIITQEKVKTIKSEMRREMKSTIILGILAITLLSNIVQAHAAWEIKQYRIIFNVDGHGNGAINGHNWYL